MVRSSYKKEKKAQSTNEKKGQSTNEKKHNQQMKEPSKYQGQRWRRGVGHR